MLKRKEELLEVIRAIPSFKYSNPLLVFLQDIGRITSVETLSPQFLSFLESTLISSELQNFEWYRRCEQSKFEEELDLRQIIDDSILLLGNKQNYVQQIGTKTIGQSVDYENISLSRQTLFSPHMQKVCRIFGEEAFQHFLIDFQVILYLIELLKQVIEKLPQVFVKADDNSYLQIAGIQISSYFSGNQKLKKNIRTIKSDQTGLTSKNLIVYQTIYPDIQRSQIFYCNHMGRKPGVFQSTFFNSSERKKANRYLKISNPNAVVRKDEKILPDPPQIIVRKNLQPEIASKHFINADNLSDNFGLRSEKECFENFAILIVQNFQKVSFNSLLKQHCSLPLEYNQIKSKVYTVVSGSQQRNLKLSEDLFDQLYKNEVSHSNMTDFIRHYIRLCVPTGLLGTGNHSIFLDKLGEFISMKRYENQKILDYLCSMDVLKVPWFIDPNNLLFTDKRKYIQQKRKALAVVIAFLLNRVIIPVLRFNFYITEKHKEGSNIFYFRKPIWKLVSKLTIVKLKLENLEVVEEKNIPETSFQKYPQGKLRIIPKKGSFRPIMTFLRKDKNKNIQMNLNQILLDSQLVLRNLKDVLGREVGYSVFDNKQISAKLTDFIVKWRAQNQPKLYFITLDIKKCYDSIDQIKLIDFFKQTKLIQETYFINKYLLLQRNKRPIQSNSKEQLESQIQKPIQNLHFPYYFNLKERQLAFSLFDSELFQKGFKEQYLDQRQSVVINLDKPRCVTKQIIEDHLQHISQYNVISFNKVKFRQKRGIPQGLNVSGVLCSFYFAVLEEESTKFLREQKNSLDLLMRLTDDYLFITSEKSNAIQLVKELTQCGAKYGFELNQEKIQTNFPLNPCEESFTETKEIQWIGKSINTETLEVKVIHKLTQQEINSTINVNLTLKNLRSTLKNKLRSFFLNQLTDYFNPEINSNLGLCKQLFHHSQATIMKFFPFMVKLERFDLKKSKQFSIIYGQKQTNQKLLRDIFSYTVEDVSKVLVYLQFDDDASPLIKQTFKVLYQWIMFEVISENLKTKKYYKITLCPLLKKTKRKIFFKLKNSCNLIKSQFEDDNNSFKKQESAFNLIIQSQLSNNINHFKLLLNPKNDDPQTL